MVSQALVLLLTNTKANMNNFPTSIDSFTTHADGDVIYAADINAIQVAVVACETLLGITGSADNTSITYKLANVTGGDRAVGASQTVTLTNKTLGTGTKVALGSDATGDTYYNGGSGTLTRLAKGSDGQVLTLASGIPSWATPATVAQGSYSTQGVLQGLTDAATSGLTIAAGVISVNSGVGANQIVKLNGSSQLPAVSGALLTNIGLGLYSPVVDSSRAGNAGAGNQTIAHGLGTTPKYVKITAWINVAAGTPAIEKFDSTGVYNGTVMKVGYSFIRYQGSGAAQVGNTSSSFIVFLIDDSGNFQKATITVDATNVTLAWTVSSSISTNNINLLVESFA